MKIRIHRNSVRFRLSKTEVSLLENEGHLEEITDFGSAQLRYAVAKSAGADLQARFEQNKITLDVPGKLLEGWAANNTVGFEGNMLLGDGSSLFMLIEKDFKCLDNVDEDQSDNYDNPKSC
ncbi:hypothetical protein GCM10007423_43070 [Dyadobacter endophyticus]|uniref:Uncharacterized protein n=1 Tax=Dyadobacter endophyticus TaxID=1749036 RepID=A0ABQ1Z2D3_9BACT|nr:hypothetical protein [Dyadobacter endophyticus]GGH44718.1 hypothetical protein GCM10007423_43070 [Dyadobacter endophyticus]